MRALTEAMDILLAEDDKDDVDIFELGLKELNLPYTLRNAENGEKLFELLAERTPHVLFLDINMPCKDGIACISEIRKNPAYDTLPVIIYSSYRSQQTVEDSYRCGANVYVEKSNTLVDLIVRLKRVFEVVWTGNGQFAPDEFLLG